MNIRSVATILLNPIVDVGGQPIPTLFYVLELLMASSYDVREISVSAQESRGNRSDYVNALAVNGFNIAGIDEPRLIFWGVRFLPGLGKQCWVTQSMVIEAPNTGPVVVVRGIASGS